jgi:hypothetical protein
MLRSSLERDFQGSLSVLEASFEVAARLRHLRMRSMGETIMN